MKRITKFFIAASCSAIAIVSFSSWRNTQAQSQRARAKTPNIVMLIADDMGYTDTSVYGSEIQTPNIDSLAKTGTQLTNFHSLPSCSPGRCEMLSGVDNHQAGLGNMSELLTDAQKGKPGYEGRLNDRVVTLPKILKDGGYHTYMVGKWHLGSQPGYIPSDEGFERSFGLMQGGGNHFDDNGFSPDAPESTYRDDGKVVKLEKVAPKFYSSIFYTNKMIEYIDSNRKDGKPFFAYVAYTAPHEPLQALKPDMEKQKGKYDIGWDKLREQRFNRMKQMGLIPDYIDLPPRIAKVPAWNSLKPEQQRHEAKKMEIYAAMVSRLDANMGRLINHLKEIGEYDNTIFVFLSDNGAAGEDFANDPRNKPAYDKWFKETGVNNSTENLGNHNSFTSYGQPWAQVGTTPFLWFKGRESEGGTHVPAIFSYPGGIKSGVRNEAFASVIDFMPTFLDYAGLKHPGTSYNGKSVFAMQGRSMRPVLEGKAERIYGPNDPIGEELYGIGNSALYMGDWKILKMSQPWGDGKWKLFNLRIDPRELNDMSQMYPQQLNKMVAHYNKYEKDKGFVPAGVTDVGL